MRGIPRSLSLSRPSRSLLGEADASVAGARGLNNQARKQKVLNIRDPPLGTSGAQGPSCELGSSREALPDFTSGSASVSMAGVQACNIGSQKKEATSELVLSHLYGLGLSAW